LNLGSRPRDFGEDDSTRGIATEIVGRRGMRTRIQAGGDFIDLWGSGGEGEEKEVLTLCTGSESLDLYQLSS